MHDTEYVQSHVRDAATRSLPSCPKCKALPGDPCRTPGWKTRKPHKEREAWLAELTRPALEQQHSERPEDSK